MRPRRPTRLTKTTPSPTSGTDAGPGVGLGYLVDPAGEDGEARLVAGIAAGDRRSLAVLYDRYAQPLYAFAFRRLGDAGLAEELVQQVLERVWRHADRYEPDRGSVRTWVLAIARNATIDLHRRRRPDRPVERVPEPPPEETPDELERLLHAEVVRAALERLSQDHRRVLDLVYFGGCTQAEVSEQLGLPLGTVKSRTYYALKALRLALDELGETP